MGAKNYDFADDVPMYREENKITYRSKSRETTHKRRRKPTQKAIPGGIRQRRNKHMNW